MPTSSLLVAPTVIDHMARLRPTSILDVGPGWGKYGVLFREYLETHPRMLAVEAHEPYVEQFRLRGIYDYVHVGDIMEYHSDALNDTDAVYLGDVIEHLEKADGFALLSRIVRPVVICTPEQFFHNPAGLPEWETHRSLWTHMDFRKTGRLTKHDLVYGGHVVTLRGQV